MSVFLGHPVYALSVVLFSLILWTGFGSMASERVRLDGAGKLVAWSVVSAAYLFALPFWLPLLFDLDGAGLLVRAGLCVLVLAPAGFLMGFGFPTGMQLVSAINTGPMPWFWGINGGAGVRRKCCLGHQYRLHHRYDAQDRSRLLPPDRRSRRVVGIRSCAIQPHGTTTPAPTQKRECVE